MPRENRHIAIFIPSLGGGGAERVMVTLANAFVERGHSVDLLLARAKGPYLHEVSNKVRIVDLKATRVVRCLYPLYRYLRREGPDAMLSALNYANVIAILAWKLARVSTRMAVSERSSLARNPTSFTGKVTRLLMRWLYPKAHKVICVSNGIEADIREIIQVPPDKTVTIYNPIDVEMVHENMTAPLAHPWFTNESAPVILAAGRLTEAKDYPTLLRAFALFRNERDAKLVILGQGEDQAKLKTLSQNLGISADVDFLGFQGNPFAYMSRCDLFVMSSAWEGFPNALVQAMACGARIVSTNCRTGPDEILEYGKWGKLVPVGDFASLCAAMADALDEELPPNGRGRVSDFTTSKIADFYENAMLA
ncbi:glycosyltransferase [Qipengyuania nanhaisediminis]|uniref:Glycosyltransferase involved in cell wall bisynthesis n=1 Tax=Qipengyuania nanhaisediminis TaxID=604088 RepID=A0A1I5QBY8_9SPHN|nr:glycosyltransferase [Qipengyuania nanhaisediminis]SFP43753.1 Glycosyltransferase involved in cell wall bisynthesis [Qipengyuania nanhaisediminis]